MVYLSSDKLLQIEKKKREHLESLVERQAADIDYIAMMGDIDLEESEPNEEIIPFLTQDEE